MCRPIYQFNFVLDMLQINFNHIKVSVILLGLFIPFHFSAQEIDETTDSIVMLNDITITAIKQGVNKNRVTSAFTELKQKDIEKLNISVAKNISEIVPNVFMPDYGSRITSSIYVRGMGTRIDQPVVGMNLDNIPIMDKNNYDFDINDIARIEVLRGPQSTLYGRNTMGGLINIYTLSPLSYQGIRFSSEYSTGNTYKVAASIYHKPSKNLGISLSGQYFSTDGLFTNDYNEEKCDKEKQGGGRFKLQWQPSNNLHIDNVFYFSILRQGGYPYESVNDNKIAYNDTCFYRRNTFNDGITINWELPKFSVSSISSVQYIDDNMTLDQDFLPKSYFTLTQARKQTTFTQDFVIKSNKSDKYNWLIGAFGFYKHLNMNAPVTFKDYGITELIEKYRNEAIPAYPISWDTREFILSSNFKNPNYGLALYHQSEYNVGNWIFSAGIRLDYEHSKLLSYSQCNTGYNTIQAENGSIYSHTPVNINDSDKINKSFLQLLPKLSITYNIPTLNNSNTFLCISKGYKAGGFNTQMFSDVLQQKIRGIMGLSQEYNIDEIVSYKPEQSWNFEIGTHLESNNQKLTSDLSFFYIHCTNQQLTCFPEGNTTGRLMTNAGKARSFGVEIAVKWNPINNLSLNANYGYTNAKFIKYNNGKQDFAGNFIPYSPNNTFFAGASYSISTKKSWLDEIIISTNVKGAGRIQWNEENNISQPFYATMGASICFKNNNYSLDFWSQNITDTNYKTFYFVSIGNSFLQRGKSRTFGATLRIEI